MSLEDLRKAIESIATENYFGYKGKHGCVEPISSQQFFLVYDGETTEDGLFTLKNVACLGCCSLSPVMMINEETYGSLTPEKTRAILAELREKAKEDAQ